MNKKFNVKKSLILGAIFVASMSFGNLAQAGTIYSNPGSASYNTYTQGTSVTLSGGLTVTTDTNPVIGTRSVTISATYDASNGTGGVNAAFYWGSTPSLGNTTIVKPYANPTGTFTETITGLTPGATYFFEPYAVNTGLGVAYGNKISLTTLSISSIQTISTTGSANITSSGATLNGFFKGDSTSPIYTEFVWGTNSANLINHTGFVLQGNTSGSFSENLTGLNPNTTYYFAASAKNDAGTVVATQILPLTTLGGGSSSNCNLASLWANPSSNTVSSGSAATIYWTPGSGCSSIKLSSSDGNFTNYDVTSLSNISTGPLYHNTSYTLTGTDSTGNVYPLYITINVSGGGTSTSCSIYSFSINGSTYAQVSNGSYANMSWSASSGCTNIYITGSNGAYLGPEPTSYNFSIGPFYGGSVTYTMHASDSSGAGTSATATVNVNSSNYNNNNYYNNNTYYGSGCSVYTFYPSSYNITSGQTVTLSWTTSSGCTSVSLTGQSGSLPYTAYNLPPNGQIQTNPLYGTTSFSINANGNISAVGPSTTVYVTGGYYSYQQSSNSNSSVITSLPTNTGAYSTRINGIVISSNSQATAYFEYGPTSNLGSMTNQQTISAGQSMVFSDTLYTNPSTTYYYRAVAQVNGITYKGDIMTVVTKSASQNTVTYTTTNTSSNSQTTANNNSSGVVLTITNKGDKVYIGDTVDFTVTYTNNTGKRLTNAKMNVILPQGFTILQTTQGQIIPPAVVNADLGALDPGKTGTIFIQANVGNSISLNNTLVTNATLSYTYPNKVSDSTVAYVLNHAGGISSLGGFSLGAGFFPTTALGWIITILIILAVILTVRRISRTKTQPTGQIHH